MARRRSLPAPALLATLLIAAGLGYAAMPAVAASKQARAAQAEPAAEALLRAALDAPRRVSYVGMLQTIRWGVRAASATIQRVEHLAPAQTRRTFLAPEALYGEYYVSSGVRTTRFDPKTHRVRTSENPVVESPVAGGASLALMTQNYRAIPGPPDNVAGRSAATLWLVNKFTGERSMRLWIDNETQIVLAKEAYRSDGSLAWRTRFDEIRFTRAIPADVFSTVVPPGFQEIPGRHFADLTDLQRALDEAGFRSVGPRYLPEGFSIVGADATPLNSVRSLHLLYSDGIRTLSLFENPGAAAVDFGEMTRSITRFEGHDAEYVKDGPTTLLAWREANLSFALVGDLDLRELVQIATSVIP